MPDDISLEMRRLLAIFVRVSSRQRQWENCRSQTDNNELDKFCPSLLECPVT